MSTNNGEKTLLGYHEKNTEKIGIIDPDSLPIFINEKYAPFLITRDHIFNISTEKILRLLRNFKTFNQFKIVKNLVAYILVIPGAIVAIIYLLKLTDVIDSPIVPDNILHFTFWLSVLGVIVLWHDYYRTKSHPTKLPKSENIPAKEKNEIKNEGIKFARYIALESTHFLSEKSIELLSTEIDVKQEKFSSFKLFKEMINDSLTKEILNRAEINELENEFEKFEINEETLPEYNIAGLRNILIYATQAAINTNSKDVDICHIVLAFFDTFPVLQNVLKSKKLSTDVLEASTKFVLKKKYKKEDAGLFNLENTYYQNGGIAKDMVYGWTFILGHFSSDVNLKIANEREEFGIGHKKTIDALTSTVGKVSKNNALLIGEPGTGKSSIIKGLAQRINRGKVPAQLKNKRIIQLDLNGLIARANKYQNLEALVEKAMQELENAENTILYIDEIHELIPAKGKDSGHSLAGIMMPYILESSFPIVGTISYADFKKYFHANQTLENSFDNIEVEEVSAESALEILTAKLPSLEKNFQLYIPIPALVAGVEYAQRYIQDRKLPDSAVNVVEAACSWAQNNNIKRLNSEHIAKAISIQYGIPIQSIDEEEATKLMKLEEKIKSRKIGQDEAVHSIVETLKRARTDVRDPNKPIGTFLFLGPTGVGKTYLAKVVAQEYFDRGEDIIRVDMSEYQDIASISKFLDTSGESQSGQNTISLIDRIKRNPYTVVLFDEIEKAHPNILNIFLQLFDEGRLTSNAGETVSFRNSIIISTSNIGSRIILDALSKDKNLWSEARDRAIIELKQAISPELFNRFDNIIVFKPHDINNLKSITELELQQLANRLSERGISVNWDDTIPMLIANKAHEPGYGARPIRRFIQQNIEGKIAEEIISSKINPGEEVTIKESWI